MSRILTIVLFFSAFILVYAGLNFYLFFRIGGLLEIKKNWIFYSIFAISVLSFFAGNFLIRIMDNWLSKSIYIISANWLGILFFSLFVILIFELAHLFVKLDNRTWAILILGVVALISVYSIINASFIRINHENIDIGLGKELKIVQISDVHLGAVHGYDYMKKIVEKTNSLNGDAVLITGDLFDGSGKVQQATINLINDIKADVYFTTGNHENYYGLEEALKQLNKTKARILRNEKVDFYGLQLIGIDNPEDFNITGNKKLGDISVNKSRPSILMFHPPQGIEEASKAGISLQLSGHVHAGQIFPFNLIEMIFIKHIYGLHKSGNTYLFITSGAGTWGPTMRFMTNSEIAEINLR